MVWGWMVPWSPSPTLTISLLSSPGSSECVVIGRTPVVSGLRSRGHSTWSDPPRHLRGPSWRLGPLQPYVVRVSG